MILSFRQREPRSVVYDSQFLILAQAYVAEIWIIKVRNIFSYIQSMTVFFNVNCTTLLHKTTTFAILQFVINNGK